MQSGDSWRIVNRFRLPILPAQYVAESVSPPKRYKHGYMMTYERGSNYQMFVVVNLSRYWFLIKMIGAKYNIPRGETLAIVVSVRETLSLHQDAAISFIENMITLLARTLPFKVEVVPEDSAIYFDELWVPGAVAHVGHACTDRHHHHGR